MNSPRRTPLDARLRALDGPRPLAILRAQVPDFFQTMTDLTGNPYYTGLRDGDLKLWADQFPAFPKLVDLASGMREPTGNDILFHLLIEPFFQYEVKR